MKKRLLARMQILLLLLVSYSAFAQNKTLSGKVTDSKDGSPLQGVSVIPAGSSRGTTTNARGEFQLSVPPTVKSLVFSSIGFTTREVPIGESGTAITVSLTAGNSSLNEIVVIGYGSARKKDLTGSVATVSEKDFQKGSITTPEQLIVGKIPGVSIISNSGQPGAGSTIRIRGGSSLNASNDPLIVIDGVPLDNDIPTGQKSAIAGASSPLSFINPNDIESFTVLKDASASAIYGTRASNGVLLITTKKGKGGPLKVNLSSTNSLSELTKKIDVLSPAQFRSVVNANGTAAKIAMLGAANTDWQDQIYQKGFGTSNNISISGGLKNFPYRISLGFQDQNGILKTDNLKRTSLAFVLNPTFFSNHLKVNLNLKGSKENTRFGNQAAIGGGVTFDPTQPVRVKSNRFGGYFEWLDPGTKTGLTNLAGRNPLGLLNQHIDKASPERSIGNLQLDYAFHFLPDLHANVNLGYDLAKGAGNLFIPDSAAEAYVAGGTGGSNNPYKVTKTNTVFEYYLSYAKDLKSIKSHVDVLAGYSYNDYLTKVYYYPTYYANGVKVPNSDPAFPFDKPEHTLISLFGRANYSYDDRYLLTGTIRRDGSSRFGPSNKYGVFPSAALAWKIKNEAFLQNNNTVSDLKLRIGYGITGQQDGIANFAYLSSYSLSNSNASYQFGNSFYQGYRPSGYNPNVKWEQTATTNIGLDYGFLDNRITGSVDLYLKKTKDLLNLIPQAAGSNFTAYVLANVGNMENKGVEFSINAEPVRTKDLIWDVSFNVTYNKNTITRLTQFPNDTAYKGFPTGTIAGGIGGQTAFINAVGSPKNTFYLYKQVYNTSGAPIEGVFVDKNGDGIINQNDLFKSKPADPKVFFGFSTNVSWRRWNGGFVLRSSLGNYAYNNINSQGGNLIQVTGNTVLYNASANYLTTKFKGNNGQELLSDYYLENASFLRMDNINIGYKVGTISHTHTTLRLNASVQNVFVITKYSGLDPEIAAGTSNNPGIDNNLYPKPRTFSLGLNLDF
ncbi:MAG TPA: TonB-dependent receptor [Puia sp.]|nr:TonB-dependent receptor [Puia sp.]